jgi:YD repeat-containing protein
MDDADMGFWGYGYDAQGRLLTQAVVRGGSAVTQLRQHILDRQVSL